MPIRSRGGATGLLVASICPARANNSMPVVGSGEVALACVLRGDWAAAAACLALPRSSSRSLPHTLIASRFACNTAAEQHTRCASVAAAVSLSPVQPLTVPLFPSSLLLPSASIQFRSNIVVLAAQLWSFAPLSRPTQVLSVPTESHTVALRNPSPPTAGILSASRPCPRRVQQLSVPIRRCSSHPHHGR